jgi:hypothetical protein
MKRRSPVFLRKEKTHDLGPPYWCQISENKYLLRHAICITNPDCNKKPEGNRSKLNYMLAAA